MRYREQFPNAVAISAKLGDGIPELLGEISSALRPIRDFVELRIPHDKPQVMARLHEVAQVIERNYKGKSARFKARIPPHWHPVDEHLTVLSGAFRLGMGESGDESATTTLRPGGYAFVPAKMAHYAWTDGDTTIQAHGIGPFVINYVNPADDPNRAGKK